MARTIKEWVGKNDDDWPPPKSCKLRVIERSNGKCVLCERTFGPKLSPQIDHVRSLKSSKLYPGENLNRESNMQALCETCHQTVKTPQDAKKHAEIARYERKLYGLEKPKSKLSRPRVSKLKIRGHWMPNDWGGLTWVPPDYGEDN